LSVAVQRVWRTQLAAFLVHGSLATIDPLASEKYTLLEGSIPSCVSSQSRDSIGYVGRAIGTVKAAKWQKQLPRDLALEHTNLLETVLPEDQHQFDRAIMQIRTNVSEWLWLNVLTQKDVEDAVDSLYVLILFHLYGNPDCIFFSEPTTFSNATGNSACPSSARLNGLNFPA
jgi:gamma-tubulin complex component 4